MKLLRFLLTIAFFICGISSLPWRGKSLQNDDHGERKRAKIHPKDTLKDIYFNEYKSKRSRANLGEDVRSYGGDFPDDFFGLQSDDSVKLMDYDQKTPIGRAENFVDPFGETVEEKNVRQFAYKQDTSSSLSSSSDEERQFSQKQEVNDSPQKEFISSFDRHHEKDSEKNSNEQLKQTSQAQENGSSDMNVQQKQSEAFSSFPINHQQPQHEMTTQNDNAAIAQRRQAREQRKKILENQLNGYRNKEMERIKASLRATAKDTETQQAKARIVAYTEKHKDDVKEKKVDSNPYAYLSLPETQSVYITPSKQKMKHMKDEDSNNEPIENISKEEDSKKGEQQEGKEKIKGVSPQQDENIKMKETSSSSKPPKEMAKEEQNKKTTENDSKEKEDIKQETSSPKLEKDEVKASSDSSTSKNFASASNETNLTPSEDTPPDHAEVVPTEVVEVQEAPAEGGSSELESGVKNAADEISSIVSSAMATSSAGDSGGEIKTSNNTNTVAPKEGQPPPPPPPPGATEDLHRLDQSAPGPPEPPPKPNKVINIKEPDLNVSISFNSTENQAKYVQRLENVIKMVKGMDEPAPLGKPSPVVIKFPEELKDKTKPNNANSEQKNSIASNTTTNVLESQKNGETTNLKDDYQYVVHDGSLFKVSKVSPEADNLIKEPSNRLATLDDQLSKLVKDAVSKINTPQPQTSDANVQKIVSASLYPAPKILRNTTSLNDDGGGEVKKGKRKKGTKQTYVNVDNFPLKTDRMREEKDKKKRKKKKQSKNKKKKQSSDSRLVVDRFDFSGDFSGDEDETEDHKSKKIEKNHFHGDNEDEDDKSEKKKMKNKKKKVHASKSDEVDENEDENEDLKKLEFHDEDEQENEKVPKPKSKSKKKKKKSRRLEKTRKEFSEDDEDDEEDKEHETRRRKKKKKRKLNYDKNENEEEEEDVDMSIHMLDKTKEGEDISDGLTFGNSPPEDSGNEMQQQEDYGIHDSVGESIAKIIKSRQKSKKLFGASLSKLVTKLDSESEGRKGVKFYVSQGGQRYQVNMTPIKSAETRTQEEDSLSVVEKTVGKKKFSKPTSSLVELPGYKIKMYTNPQFHTKTYEIKHGDKMFTVVEKNHDRDGEVETGAVRGLHPSVDGEISQVISDGTPPPMKTTIIRQITKPLLLEDAQSLLEDNTPTSTDEPIKTTIVRQITNPESQGQTETVLLRQLQEDLPAKTNIIQQITKSGLPTETLSNQQSREVKNIDSSQQERSPTKLTVDKKTGEQSNSPTKENLVNNSIAAQEHLSNTFKQKEEDSPKTQLKKSPKKVEEEDSSRNHLKQNKKPQEETQSSNPSITLQSSIHKEITMNGKPQHIISSFVTEDFQPTVQEHATKSSGNIFEPSISKFPEEAIDIPTISNLVHQQTKDIELETQSKEVASIVPSNLKNLEKLKTLIPTFMGTRKAELPKMQGSVVADSTEKSTGSSPGSNVNGVDSPGSEKSLSSPSIGNDFIKSKGNTLSQEIKGVTNNLSLTKSNISSDEFDKTLNADIVLK